MTDKQRPPYEIALMHDHILRLEEELKGKEQECERLRDTYKKRLKIFCDMYNKLKKENEELKKSLKKIKEILELYAGSHIGNRQNDGTYRIYLHPSHHACINHYEPCYYVYDPKPAKYAVKILEKCEVIYER